MGAGVVWRRPFGDRLRTVDLRPQRIELRGEPVIAADDRVVLVDARVEVQVHDAARATYAVEDYRRALERVAVLALRDDGGTLTAPELLAGGDRLRSGLHAACRGAGDAWGVRVPSVDVRVRPWEPGPSSLTRAASR